MKTENDEDFMLSPRDSMIVMSCGTISLLLLILIMTFCIAIIIKQM